MPTQTMPKVRVMDTHARWSDYGHGDPAAVVYCWCKKIGFETLSGDCCHSHLSNECDLDQVFFSGRVLADGRTATLTGSLGDNTDEEDSDLFLTFLMDLLEKFPKVRQVLLFKH